MSGARSRTIAASAGRLSRFTALTTVASFSLTPGSLATNRAASITSSRSAFSPRIARWTAAVEPSTEMPTMAKSARLSPWARRLRRSSPLVLSTMDLPRCRSVAAYSPILRISSGSPPHSVTTRAEEAASDWRISGRRSTGSLPGTGP